MQKLSVNTKAILLLTAPLIAGRGSSESDILTPGEYNRLARHLHAMQCEPADLLSQESGNLYRACQDVVDAKRMQSLLGRGFLLSQVVEHWQTRAIWVLSRADAAYPRRIKTRLREGAPAVLYGCGDIKLLETGGLAVVGSRHVDQAAMRGALEAGGKVSGVLADRLEKTAMNREHHNLLIDGQLVLISPYDPSAGWFLSMCDHLEFLQKVSKPCVRRELYPGLNLNLLMLLMRFLIPQIRIWKQGVLQKSWKKNQRLNRAWPCLKIFRISSSIDSCPSWDGRKNTRKG